MKGMIYLSFLLFAMNNVYSQDIPICAASGDQKIPAIATWGNKTLIAWLDYRNSNLYADVRGRVIDGDGAFVGDELIIFPNPGNNIIQPYSCKVCYGNYDFLTIWANGTRQKIQGRRISVYGTIASDTFTVASVGMLSADLAYYNNNYLVVYDNYGDIYGKLVNIQGVPGNEFSICTMSDLQYFPADAWGGNYLVVWEDRRSGSNYDIYGQLVSATGQLIGTEIAISTGAWRQEMPKVVSCGTNFMVIWRDNRNSRWDLYAQLISTSGSLIGTNFIVVNTGVLAADFDIVRRVFDYNVVWSDNGNICGRWVSSGGNLGGVIQLTNLGNAYYPVLSVDVGNPCFLAWSDTRNGNYDVYCRRNPAIGIEENFTNRYSQTAFCITASTFQNHNLSYTLSTHISVTCNVSLYNIQGEKITSWRISAPKGISHYSKNISTLPKGIYFCRIETDNFATEKKIVKLEKQ